MTEAAGILSVVLGREWLRSVAERPDHSSAFQLGRHPLGHALTAGGETKVVEILELAEYLKSAADLQGFGVMVAGLKSQYWQTLLPLAFVHRVALLGAEDLALEPAASGGRVADVAMVWDGEPYLVECYRPTIAGRPEDHIGRLIRGVLEQFSREERPVAVAIKLHRPLDHRTRKAVVRSVTVAMRDLAEGGFREALLVEDDNALISVAPTEVVPAGHDSKLMLHPDFPRLPNEASQFARLGVGTRDALNVVSPTLENPTHSCVAAWEDEATVQSRGTPDTTAAFKRVVKKVNRKLAQTRSEQDARRLAVVDTWVAEHLDQLKVDADDYMRNQVLRQHGGATSVLLVRRGWHGDAQRFRYRYRVFAEDGDANATGLAQALIAWEHQNKVPHGTAER